MRKELILYLALTGEVIVLLFFFFMTTTTMITTAATATPARARKRNVSPTAKPTTVQTDRQTDRQTNGWMDRQTGKFARVTTNSH